MARYRRGGKRLTYGQLARKNLFGMIRKDGHRIKKFSNRVGRAGCRALSSGAKPYLKRFL